MIDSIIQKGEANAFWNRDQYDCTFSQLISEWRRVWSINTGTNPNFPFGFVQLSTWQANDLSPDFPMIRWYQTYKTGYTPNIVLQASCICCILYVFIFYRDNSCRMYSWQYH